jgi:bromodomain and PHD finger-containing protein 1
MDEEDNVWLKLINEQRQTADPPLSAVDQHQFELLMDRLEKESYFQASTINHNRASLNKSANDSTSKF